MTEVLEENIQDMSGVQKKERENMDWKMPSFIVVQLTGTVIGAQILGSNSKKFPLFWEVIQRKMRLYKYKYIETMAY